MVGVDLTKVAQLPITLVAGQLPAPGSLSQVAVTEGYLERLGLSRLQATRVVGTTVVLASPRLVIDAGQTRYQGRWVKMSIVGVVAQDAGDGQFLATTTAVDQARAWAESGDDHGRLLAQDSNGILSPYAGLFVVARGLDNVAKVRLEITSVGYSTSAPENLIASVRRYLRVVEIVLSAVGLIALLVAALGITNAMLAAVRERRREIGVLKAIGARDRDIYRTFLLEAATLGLIGGALGALRRVGDRLGGGGRGQRVPGPAAPGWHPCVAAVVGHRRGAGRIDAAGPRRRRPPGGTGGPDAGPGGGVGCLTVAARSARAGRRSSPWTA